MNIHSKKLLSGSLVATLLSIPTMVAFAASDGSKGNTSAGNLVINANVPEKVQITKFTDIDLEDLSHTGPTTKDDLLCVYSNKNGEYKLKVTSANEGFKLKSASSPADEIPYTVKYATSTETIFDAATAVVYNTTIEEGLGNASATSTSCSGGHNSKLFIQVAATDVESAIAHADYGDTLTITVAGPNQTL